MPAFVNRLERVLFEIRKPICLTKFMKMKKTIQQRAMQDPSVLLATRFPNRIDALRATHASRDEVPSDRITQVLTVLSER